MSDNSSLALKIVGAIVALAILFPVNTYINNHTSSAAKDARFAKTQSLEICVDTNKNRKIGNERAMVIREFLQIAADGRHDSYIANHTINPHQAQIDKDLEHKYITLKGKVKLTRLLICSKEDGE